MSDGNTMTAAAGAAPSTLTLDTASQASSLDQLAGLASTMEGAGQAAPGGAPGAPLQLQMQRQTNAMTIKGALIAGREGFCMFTELQSPRATMSDAKCGEVAELWGAWCDKRGLDLASKMGEHADTLAASLATFMLAVAVYQAARTELATRKPVEVKGAKSKADQTATPPAGETVNGAGPTGSNVHVFPGQGGRGDES